MAPLWIRHALPCHPYTPERSVLVHRIFAFGLVPCLVSRVLLRGLTACTVVSFSEAQLLHGQLKRSVNGHQRVIRYLNLLAALFYSITALYR